MGTQVRLRRKHDSYVIYPLPRSGSAQSGVIATIEGPYFNKRFSR